MTIEIGRVAALYRYPVKSMRGQALDAAALDWHGVEGDRRLAVRRLGVAGDFPWLTAGRLAELLCFAPQGGDPAGGGAPATHVATPDGRVLPVFGDELAAEIARRHGAPVQMMQLRHGVYDDASVSLIASGTVDAIGRLAGLAIDARRFRPNIVVDGGSGGPFHEDAWVGHVLTFGDGDDAAAIAVTRPDVRCAMVNIDPDDASIAAAVLKAVVGANRNHAGVYATVVRAGRLAVGQAIRVRPGPGQAVPVRPAQAGTGSAFGV